jgi:hypothetical protein
VLFLDLDILIEINGLGFFKRNLILLIFLILNFQNTDIFLLVIEVLDLHALRLYIQCLFLWRPSTNVIGFILAFKELNRSSVASLLLIVFLLLQSQVLADSLHLESTWVEYLMRTRILLRHDVLFLF